MHKIPFYQVDAFSDRLFGGNPAGVCPLQSWPDDSLMQSVAMENNLAETAFFVQEGGRYIIRWFTPTVEVDLCGLATLTPYWSKRLGKKRLSARQISCRGGALECTDAGERVIIGGNATLYLTGEIILSEF